ncbi:MAG: alkaline phosphatase family protein [Marinobacterium sp.]|nr:alkaline phosphatase family protein [Marinobacterium sp.]
MSQVEQSQRVQSVSEFSLPAILAGPVLRRLTPRQAIFWLVCRSPLQLRFTLRQGHQLLDERILDGQYCNWVQIGEHAWVCLIILPFEQPLPEQQVLHYDFHVMSEQEQSEQSEQNLAELMPWLVYEGESSPSFVCNTRLSHLLHGSCRKPHYPSEDALVRADCELQAATARQADTRPDMLLMSGDQIYADDVAGPMLYAVHQVIERLGLWPEQLEGAVVNDSQALYQSPDSYYRRMELLPHDRASAALADRFFAGARKPIFTSDNADNHLITLAEVLAMYLLVWSPQLWAEIKLEDGLKRVPDEQMELYLAEQQHISDFAAGLPQVQRLLAHLPSYMIFDDHDVTDDWNLTRGWEETAYGHPFSKRIIGNAMIGYWLCQGWGNAPERFDNTFMQQALGYFRQPDHEHHNVLVDQVLHYDQWHYSLDTQPRVVVLDTRTHRWRSESSAGRPSGLMDWESLSDLQQELINEDAVILVSPAPIFGVKLIEIVQRVFTWCGYALTVDAENWMAHPGSANVILNIFQHARTPQNFIVLSGDVHYSFAYDIRLRSRKSSPNIWQITCSGFKNEFPHRLLKVFDRANIALFSSSSPLNWLTRRRRLKVRARKPDGQEHTRLSNASGIGQVKLDSEGRPTEIKVLQADGRNVEFVRGKRLLQRHRLGGETKSQD